MSKDKQPNQEQDKRLDEAFEELEKTQASTDTSSEQPEQTSRQSSSQQKGPSSVAGLLALLIALVALGVASYPAYELYRQASENPAPEEADSRLDALNLKIDRLAGQFGQSQLPQEAVSKLSNDLNKLNARVEAQAAASQAAADQFATQLAAVRDRLGTTSQDWVLAEVEYLVRMAVQRVLLEKDATSAIELLGSADEIIRNTEGLTAHALREALANDLASLKAVNTPDTQGAYLAISALVNQVPLLRREMPVFNPPARTDDVAPSMSTVDRVLAAGKRALGRLSDLVDFRRNQVEIKPILPPHEEYFLRQNLILKLQLAQMALLEGDQQVYETALSEAQAWAAAGFDIDDAATASMLAELERLSALRIAVDLPDISGSLRAVRQTLGKFGQEGTQ